MWSPGFHSSLGSDAKEATLDPETPHSSLLVRSWFNFLVSFGYKEGPWAESVQLCAVFCLT